MKYNKGFANIILVVVIVAIVAVGGYFVLNRKTQELNINQTSNTTATIPKDWTTYTHSTGLYSLSYPSVWDIEAGSTKTSLLVRIDGANGQKLLTTNVIDVRIDLDNQQLNFIQTSAKAQNTSMVQKKWKSVGGYQIDENTFTLTTEEMQTRDRNAKIVTDMAQLQTTAELIFSSNNGYATFCSNGLMNINAKPLTDLPALVQDIVTAQQVSSQSQAGITCISNQNKYVLRIIFTKSIAGYPQSFCIDSLGHMGDDRKFKLDSTTVSCQKIES